MVDSGAKALSREALEFAPGLLAIQETPPAKWPRAVMYIVLVLFAALLAWAFFGRLDIIASANGRLVPKTYVKIVQPAEAGIVQETLVTEGEEVRKGQILMRMDATTAEADARTIRNELALAGLQLRRIDAELTGAPMQANSDDAPDLYAQVENQFRAHRRAYLDAVAQETAARDKARYDLEAAEEVLRKLQQVVPMYRKEAAAVEELAKKGHISTLAAGEKRREAVEKAQDLRAQTATVQSLDATIAASEKRLAQISSSYLSQLQNERIETERQFRRLREEREKIEYRNRLLVLRAPQAGTIKDLAVHTRGTVVSPGAVLMSLVPHSEPLQAEVMVENKDVGFVRTGQRVKIKLAPYSFQKYGMLEGFVARVSPDAASDSPPEQSATEAAAAPPGLLYKALIELDSQILLSDGYKMALTPGMQAVAEIHLGRRTVMEYLLSPVKKAWQEAGRER